MQKKRELIVKKDMDVKRLFLFAAYDKQGIIDNTLLHYLRALSGLGDIVFVMDSDVAESEFAKLKQIPNILHAVATRHGEYDFGSYKRAYQWADSRGLLQSYDWIYLVNDSVYGPLFDISRILADLESRGVDLTGMIDFQNKQTPVQVQSWFVGLSSDLANQKFIRKFMDGVRTQENKQLIVLKYEVGLSTIALQHGYKMSTLISGEVGDDKHRIYDCPLTMLKCGLPFLKKNAVANLPGLQYLYPYTTVSFVDDIYHNLMRSGLTIAVTESERPKYQKSYRLTCLSIPLITIYRQRHASSALTCYKVVLFDFIPVFKILIHK